MQFSEKIFREYDIRGVVGKDFDHELAYLLGRAYAEIVLAAKYSTLPVGRKPRIAVGQDCRLSGPELSKALMNGLRDGGVDVISTGMGPTPQLYFSVVSGLLKEGPLEGGIQVTGSHNPSDQNGFKMMIGKHTLSGEDIVYLKSVVTKLQKNHIANNQMIGQSPQTNQTRGELTDCNARELYLKDLITRSQPQMGPRKLKIVVDGGNGVGGLVGPDLLRALGCEVVELFTEPDGRFPNHHPDPTVLENIVELRKRVVSEKADVGIAWDGDADRIGVVDEKGDPIFGDMLLLIYGRQLLKEISKPIIVADVKCSELLFDDLEKRGAQAVMSRTGHSLIKAKMKELHAHLAGEMSGHMFFAHRYYGFDDAIHASARLVEILSHHQGPMSSLLDGVPKTVSTPEIRMDCAEELKFKIAERAKSAFPEYQINTIDGVRVKFPHGWGLVRASNTQPVLVLRFEAETKSQLDEYEELFRKRIQAIQQELSAGS
jgi:phosphomannomutase/phosphoglucomutase